MRMMAPVPAEDLDDLAIDAAYPWPGPGRWIRCNMVSTADGSARGPAGRSGDISSPADMRVFGRLRGLADVVVVGAGTVRAEAYRPARARAAFADRRRDAGQRPAPVIAIVSASLDIDLSVPLFTDPVERPVIVTVADAPADRIRAARSVADVVLAGERRVDLTAALDDLVDRGLPRILSEGGPSVLAELVALDLLDELDLTLSPVLAGGSYPAEVHPPRILRGVPLPDPPRPMRLAHVLAEDGMLFLRYLLRGHA